MKQLCSTQPDVLLNSDGKYGTKWIKKENLLKVAPLFCASRDEVSETGKMPEELENDTEEAHALSYDEVKEKMDDSDDSKE